VTEQPRIFFAYPSEPSILGETIWHASKGIAASGVACQLWEDLAVSGKMVIDRILEAIANADVSVFEITHLNQNVMFELGCAIGSNKKVWLLKNPANEVASKRWDQVKMLTTVGYTAYANSHEIESRFFREAPHETAEPISRPR
jgi:nucleoside 2-deoxyribosyltransferase